MGQPNNPQGGNPKTVNRVLLVIFAIVGVIQITLLIYGFSFPLQIITIVLNLIGLFYTITQAAAPNFSSIGSIFRRLPRSVNIAIPIILCILLFLSLIANILFISHKGFASGPPQQTTSPTPGIVTRNTVTVTVSISPTATPTTGITPTATTSTTCPYKTRKDFADNLRDIPMNVFVPQGCYMLLSIYNGYYTTPDTVNITEGSLLAFQGPISISAFLSGGGGGFAGFSDEPTAKAFYCTALHSGNAYGITKTAHSLDWAPAC